MRNRRDNRTRPSSTADHPVRAVPAVVILAAALGFAGVPGITAAKDTESTGLAVDERVGLLDEAWRLWRIPVRYAASRSPYFQPGLPPYRQQPEKAQQQPLPEAGESATETAAPSPPSSNSSEGGSKSPSGGGSEGPSSGGGSEGSSSGSSESDTPTLTLIEPTPTFTPVDTGPQPGEAPTPTQTPGGS